MALEANSRKPANKPDTERSRRREREILDAAAEIFKRQGYADTSVQDVADAVGMLKGSLYYYIDSKEDLLFRVLLKVHNDAKVIVDDVEAMDAAPLDRLREYIRRHVVYNTHNLAKIAVYYHDFALLSRDRKRLIADQRHVYEACVTGLIEEAQERGDIDRQVDATLAANAVFGILNWIYTWFRQGGGVSGEYLGDLYAEMAIAALTGDLPAPPTATAKKPGARKRQAKASGDGAAARRKKSAK